MGELDNLIAEINKREGYQALFYGSDYEHPKVRKIPTGSLYMDWALSGGIPVGKITEIFGRESSGKSAIATRVIVQAQKLGKNCVWIDAENSFDPEWMTKLGVDIEKLVVVSSSEGEDMLDLILELVSMGNPRSKEHKGKPIVDLVVCDSVAALAPMKIIVDEMEQAQMAVEARMMNKGIKRINARNKNTAVIFINQLRTGFGRMASDVTPGGRGLPFFAALRLDVRGGEWIKPVDVPPYMKVPESKDKDAQIGHTINIRVKKSKVGTPYRMCSFDFYYHGKIDVIKDIISVGKITGVVDQAGAFYKYEGNSYRGAKAFGDFLKANRETLVDIRTRVLESL